ncbi:MAG: DMT family transporter [Victivallales bacterium]|nr:DMT family transporter [Victivallales bacterium]
MNRLQANLCLLCVTLCWSIEVILFSCVPDDVPTFATPCVTSFAGSLLLLVPFYRRVWGELRQHGRTLFLKCLLLAALSAAYNTMYLYGMKWFDVAAGAFTLCMTVVVLPVILLSIRRRVPLETWLSVMLVTMGICLALGPSLRGEQLAGLAIMGGGCLLRAVLIVLLADWAKTYDPLTIATLLELFAGILALGGWFWEDPRLFLGLPVSRTLVATWSIYSYFVVAIAHALNFFAMRRVTAMNATVVYSMEIVFSIIWGVILPAGVIEPVKLSPSVFLGTVLVVVGCMAEVIDFRGRRHQQETRSKEDSA